MPSMEKASLAEIVGANIVRLRKARDLSQRALAIRLNMGPDSLSRIERGIVAPRFGRLEKLAMALECTVAELFVDPNRQDTQPQPMSPQEELQFLSERLAAVVRQLPEKTRGIIKHSIRARQKRPFNRNRHAVTVGT